MHPESLWITRLEAELPIAALASDLTLEPAAQTAVSHFVDAAQSDGNPCNAEGLVMHPAARRGLRVASAPGVLLLGIGLAIARRRSRRAARR
jgi:hypothetical protein